MTLPTTSDAVVVLRLMPGLVWPATGWPARDTLLLSSVTCDEPVTRIPIPVLLVTLKPLIVIQLLDEP